MKLECIGFVNFQPENIRQGIYGLVTIVLERAWAALKCDQLPVGLSCCFLSANCLFSLAHLGVEDLKTQMRGSTSSLGSESNSSTDTKTEGSIKSARDKGPLEKAHAR